MKVKKQIIPLSLVALLAMNAVIAYSFWLITTGDKSADISNDSSASAPVCYSYVTSSGPSSTKTYYTSLGKALDKCNDSTAHTIVMIPVDSKTIYTYSGTHTLGSNDTLILPYDSNENYHEEVKEASSKFADNNALKYRKCRLELGVDENGKEVEATLNINSGAKVYIGGKRLGQGYTAEDYAEIYMSDKATINNYGTIYSYGFIKENTDDKSSINCKIGSSIYLPMVIYDWGSAGDALAKTNNGAFVSNRYDFPNVRPTINAVNGSNIVGMVYTYGSNAGQIIEEAKVFSTNDAMFLATSPNAFLSFNFYDSNPSSTQSDKEHKSTIIASGNLELSHIAITVKRVISYTIDSANFYLPIPGNFNISFDNGVLSLPNKIKFLPGSAVTIGESATCIMNNNIDFYQSDSYTNSSEKTVTMPSSISKLAATFINNGTLYINAKFSGFIQTTSSNSKIITGSEFAVVDDCYEVAISGSGIGAKGEKIGPFAFPATGYIGSSITNENFCSASYYVGKGSYWEKLDVKTYTISFTVNSNDKPVNYTDADFEYVLTAKDKDSETSYTVNNSNYSYPIKLVKGTTYTIIAKTPAASISRTDGTVDADENISIKCNKGIKKHKIEVKYKDLDDENPTTTRQATYYAYLYKNELDTEIVRIVTLSKDSTTGYVYDGYYVEIRNDGHGSGETITMNDENYELNQRFRVTESISIVSNYDNNDGCIIEGTLITMADGSYKKVEDVASGDEVMVFNHETGRIETSKVVFNDHAEECAKEYSVVWCEFSNGSKIGVVYEHGFFCVEENKYVYIDENNYASYIGKHFVTFDGEGNKEIVKLNNSYIEKKVCKIYSPVTKSTLNYFTEGMLSMPGGISGLFNIFEYEPSTLKYDEAKKQEDIEKYGLFTLEDFGGRIDEFMFDAFNGQYLSVSIGKGMLTWERIEELVKRYAPLCK